MNTISRSVTYLQPIIESHPAGKPLIIGVSGPQGSGKSYLSSRLSSRLTELYPTLTTIDISTDDFYLTFEDQQLLQAKYPDNWMISGRGPPGTHDLLLLNKFINSVIDGEVVESIPRYDKSAYGGKGDRLTRDKWTPLLRKVDILIIEGWFNGYKSIPDDELLSKWPKDDSRFVKVDEQSLRFVNDLLSHYEEIWDKFNYFVFLSTSNLQNVYTWRIDQEHNLKLHTGGQGMTDEEVVSFVDRYMPCYELYYDNLIERGCLPLGHNLKLEIDLQRNIINDEII